MKNRDCTCLSIEQPKKARDSPGTEKVPVENIPRTLDEIGMSTPNGCSVSSLRTDQRTNLPAAMLAPEAEAAEASTLLQFHPPVGRTDHCYFMMWSCM